jgi:N utilization substance protein A
MREDLLPILRQLQSERHVDRHVLTEAVRSAIESAAKKSLSHPNSVSIEIDEETFEIKLTEAKEVVKKVTDPSAQISLDEALEIQPDVQPGDTVQVPTSLRGFGRIATQTAKQIIIQKIRDAERERLFEEYKKREGEVVTGTVKRVHRGNVIVELGEVEGLLPYREQSPRESYAPGNRIRAYILAVEKSSRGPQIIMSRAATAFVRMLFELEVPEIYDGTITIKAIAREAGNRTKIGVESNDADVDPVGACVGMKGTRVRSVVDELSGEKIDIVRWSDDPKVFVRNALSPAEISSITVDKDAGTVKVLVPRAQLSLAIGKKGQNARLASKLSGLQIDISSEEEALEEAVATEVEPERSVELVAVPGIGPVTARKLEEAGFETLDRLRAATVEQLCSVPGVGKKTAQKIVEAVSAVEAEDLHEQERAEDDAASQQSGELSE